MRLSDCPAIHAEDTRLTNPPVTLRGTGWNRFETLCRDPQATAIVPFEFNIANRIVAKDNHRPYIQRPINQSAALPSANASDDFSTSHIGKPWEGAPSDESTQSTSWKSCNFYDSYSA
jgi:hypothetical protein